MLYTTLFAVFYFLFVAVNAAHVGRVRSWLATNHPTSWSKSTPLKRVGKALSKGELASYSPEAEGWSRTAKTLRIIHWLLAPLLVVAIYLDLTS